VKLLYRSSNEALVTRSFADVFLVRLAKRPSVITQSARLPKLQFSHGYLILFKPTSNIAANQSIVVVFFFLIFN
jgi:hypothetical protein